MNDGRMNDMFKQMDELFLKVDSLTLEITTLKKTHDKEIKKLKKEHKKEIQNLKEELKEKDAKIEKLEKENQKLKTEVSRLKNQNKKDSSNSNKPSGTNGFKKVITNRREKSDKKPGGQEGHKGNSLGKEKFEEKEYQKIMKEYGEIIKEWKKEWMADNNNPEYENERKLLSRMEEEDKEQILYFLKDFKVPATNNQVETDQRNIKIKQKIGKFRSEIGAEIYAIIRSCINTYKKHGINVYRALIKAFNNETVIA